MTIIRALNDILKCPILLIKMSKNSKNIIFKWEKQQILNSNKLKPSNVGVFARKWLVWVDWSSVVADYFLLTYIWC